MVMKMRRQMTGKDNDDFTPFILNLDSAGGREAPDGVVR